MDAIKLLAAYTGYGGGAPSLSSDGVVQLLKGDGSMVTGLASAARHIASTASAKPIAGVDDAQV